MKRKFIAQTERFFVIG